MNNDEDNYYETYEAPRNFKKGRYLMGKFTIKAAITGIASIVATIASIMLYASIASAPSFLVILSMLIPCMIVTILIIPIPSSQHQNTFNSLYSKIKRQLSQKTYRWEGYHHNEKLTEDEKYSLPGHDVHVENKLEEYKEEE